MKEKRVPVTVYEYAPHFRPDFGPKRFSKLGPNPDPDLQLCFGA